MLRKIKNLKFPEHIRSTELRKYCATVIEIADLSKTDGSMVNRAFSLQFRCTQRVL